MGSPADDVTRKMAAMSRAIERENRDSVTRGALAMKQEIEATRDKATGGDGVLSGVGRSGARLGAGFDIRGVQNPTALVRARGPWQFVEHPIGAHIITPRRSGARRNLSAAGRLLGGQGRAARRVAEQAGELGGLGSRRGSGRRAILVGGDTPRAYARHPGISGGSQPKPWRKGVAKGAPKAVQAMGSNFTRAIGKAFLS